jgi:hypothetical protein
MKGWFHPMGTFKRSQGSIIPMQVAEFAVSGGIDN